MPQRVEREPFAYRTWVEITVGPFAGFCGRVMHCYAVPQSAFPSYYIALEGTMKGSGYYPRWAIRCV